MMHTAKQSLFDGDVKKLFTDMKYNKTTAKLLVRINERRFPNKSEAQSIRKL
jgi:hypothetical protein